MSIGNFEEKKDQKVHQFKILGEPASKANSRKIVIIRGRPASIKSDKARKYAKYFEEQCQTLDELFSGDVSVEMLIYYASRRPDLDESLILDLMQGKIYKNDRQVKQKNIYWGLDRENPRTLIRVSSLESGNIPSYFRCIPE